MALQGFWDLPVQAGFRNRLLSLLLTPPSLVYGGIQRVRRWLYRRGVLRQRRLPVPVVSIGGLRVGGVGKTPFTQWMAAGLCDRGVRVAVLTRGYGRRRSSGTQILTRSELGNWRPVDCGDEPYQLAGALPDVPVAVNGNRYEAARSVMAATAVDLFLLDDGFQHQQLARDLDVVLIPEDPRDLAVCLPKGPLREPESALEDAHILVSTGMFGANRKEIDLKRMRRTRPDAVQPVFTATFEPGDLFTVEGHDLVEPALLQGARILAFCGIARPALFWSTLETKGVRISSRMVFPDHCPYSDKEYEKILEGLSGMDWAVTTEKDAGKIARFTWPGKNVLFLRLDTIVEAEESFWRTLYKRGIFKHA